MIAEKESPGFIRGENVTTMLGFPTWWVTWDNPVTSRNGVVVTTTLWWEDKYDEQED